MYPSVRPIANGDRTILACILRAAACADRDPDSVLLRGVGIERCGQEVRCAGTDGKKLAVCHAWGEGIDLPEQAIIHPDSLPRVADLYRRCRAGIATVLHRRDPSRGGAPVVTAAVETRGERGQAGWMRLLHIRVPAQDDGCTLRILEGTFPSYAPIMARVGYRMGFAEGDNFDARHLIIAQRVLGTRCLVPWRGTRGAIFTGQSGDFVLVMPISTDKEAVQWIFGRPDETGAA